ncbi:bifunctional RNase H/acid phosphatase [Nonomuraea endophytica]|uniref:Putative phosphoglycerate mutase n=1 Tax=Nonomuraea endophytica TaxID=714136 RepID=A0A7W8AE70_9ACTN|nr:bifunctional RNase H/acid phosphatase [Nonomuraea endophytica]MBB5084647.1 putative phosphoglycerate mutase [Nonomuraea endophytica]
MTSYIIEADGGSRGNPGPAGYGAVVLDAADRQVLAETAEAIGVTTNNVAEYRGLIAGLTEVLRLGGEGAAVAVRMDSKLVVEQMAGNWKIKNEGLRPLALEANRLAGRLRVTEWTWIPRERNKHADRLANEAMDAAAKGLPWHQTTPDHGNPEGSTTTAREDHGGPETATAAPREDRGGVGKQGDLPTASAGRRGSGEPGSGAGEPGAPDIGRDAAGQTELFVDGGAATGRVARKTPSPSADLSAPSASTAARQTRAKGSGWGDATRVATSLLLLRHGETPLSVERRFSGLGDAELTANGLAQAAAAAERLSREPYRLDVVVSSPLKRARQTAEAVAARAGLGVEVDEDLRETDFGAWEGHTFTEIQRRWPEELAAWLAEPSVAPPDGESFAEAGRRVQRVRDRLVKQHLGKTVLVVSHVTPIKMLLRFALMAPPAALYRMHLDLACLSLVDYYADGNAVVKAFNDTAHLR